MSQQKTSLTIGVSHQNNMLVDIDSIRVNDGPIARELRYDSNFTGLMRKAIMEADASRIIDLNKIPTKQSPLNASTELSHSSVTIALNVDHDAPASEQIAELMQRLENNEPVGHIDDVHLASEGKQPPVKATSYLVTLSVNGKPNMLSVALPAMTALEASNMAIDFIHEQRPDISKADILPLNASFAESDYNILKNRQHPDYRDFPNRSTYDAFHAIAKEKHLLAKIGNVVRDDETYLSMNDVQRYTRMAHTLNKEDGAIQWRAVAGKLNELINGVSYTAPTLHDNRDELAARAANWFDFNSQQKNILTHLSPKTESLSSYGIPFHMAESPKALSRFSRIVMASISQHDQLPPDLVKPNPERYDQHLSIEDIGEKTLIDAIKRSAPRPAQRREHAHTTSFDMS